LHPETKNMITAVTPISVSFGKQFREVVDNLFLINIFFKK